MSPELIGEVIETPSHLFILNFDSAIVVPTRAFPSHEAAQVMAESLHAFMQRPWPFEG